MHPLLLNEPEINALLTLVSLHCDRHDTLMAGVRQQLIDMKVTIATEPQRQMLDDMVADRERMAALMKRIENDPKKRGF